MHRQPSPGVPLRLLLLTLGLTFLLAGAAEAALTYTLGAPLKATGCSGDTDNDCLNNVQEVNLGWAVSPWYFYDEDEDCSGWENKFGLPSSHFYRRDYIQVRPNGSAVSGWSPTDGLAKWVTITYVFNYPHDCGNNFGVFGGHQGDSESIRFHLYSYNLQTWYLSHAYYWHHDRIDYVAGSFLESNALALGTSWASVTADEDKHGSWPGRVVSSSHCAGSMDDFCLGTCDCFQNTWQWDFNNGYFDVPSASQNVGGPSPETWIPGPLTIAGGEAYTAMDVGHGLNREYWTPKPGAYGKFCGWECPAANRTSGGDCTLTIHDRSNCAGGHLSTKVDTYGFTLSLAGPPPASVAAADLVFDPAPATPVAARGEPDRHRARQGRRLGEKAARRLRERLATDETLGGNQRQLYLARARDPVAAAVPHLLGMSRELQLATLRWMLTVPDRTRLALLFDDLKGRRGLELELASEKAGERVQNLIAWLESRGVVAADVPAGLVLAAVVEDAPAPNTDPVGGAR